ncbi:UdgX family uracil-DNA binding protein [Noviherbaspirillum sp. 1P10PC]|uniref:UdgX family uracil-DNA binding protein n=1 Tax=Noviherbaspirillum sp. 1P10PC TaxID=3132292 RepID=UPI00399FB33F
MSRRVAVGAFGEWRNAARTLLAQAVPPHDVDWVAPGDADLFGNEALDTLAAASTPGPALRISSGLLGMLEAASCFRADDRWALLYRILWRSQHGDAAVLSAADCDGARLHAMVKAVRREQHKMHAFLRFRERDPAAGDPRFIAWFEPAHDVLHQAAGHFAKRMGRASWLIVTPDGTAASDGETLRFGPAPAERPAEVDIDDQGEALWLAYYRSIYNPSRLNTGAMEMHMPVRYWKNLPEGRLIPGLISSASAGGRRVGQALEVGARPGALVQVDAQQAMPPRALPSELSQCRRCELWRNATQAVPGAGPGQAALMLVGEQPGDQEDLAGLPFAGPAGKVLDDAMRQAGIERQSAYLTNAVKHFKWEPRGKRRIHKTPAQREVDACNPWLRKELADVAPEVVVALGSTALRALTGRTDLALSTVQGRALRLGECWLVPTWHPSYVLRLPGQQEQAAAFDAMRKALQLAKSLLAGQAEPV